MLNSQSRAHSKQTMNVTFLVANMLAACVFVFRASVAWAIPEEHCEIPVAGEPFAWFAAILPVILVLTPVNLTWAALIFRSRDWRSARFWLPAACAWLIAIVTDHVHHC